MTFAGFLVRFRHDEQTDPRFLFWATQSQTFQGQVQADAITSTIQNFSADRYANVSIWRPRLEDQRQIADFLDSEVRTLEEVVRLRQDQVEAARERHSSLLNARTVPVEAGGGADASAWGSRSLRSLCWFFQDGDWIESPYITEEGIRLIQTGNVGISQYKEQGFKYISAATFRALKCTAVYPEDVLISRLSPPVARACLAPDMGTAMIASVDVVIARVMPELVRGDYLVHYLSSPRHLSDADIQARGSTMMRLSRSQVGALRVPLPPLQTQAALARELSESFVATQVVIAEMQAQIGLLQERKRSLITASGTGELDVTAASGRSL